MRLQSAIVPRHLGCALALMALASGCSDPVEPFDDSLGREVLTVFYHDLGGPHWFNSGNWLTDAPLNTWYGVTTDAAGNVTGLDLSGNGLGGVLPGELGTLEHLKHLVLPRNSVWGFIPSQLGNLENLETLSLMSTRLSGSIPREFAGLRNLETLFLSDTHVGGFVPPELGELHNLRYVRLERTSVTGGVHPEFGNLRKLEVLVLDDTEMSGRLPAELIGIPLHMFFWSRWDGMGLCAPPDDAFQAWLATIRFAGGPTCPS